MNKQPSTRVRKPSDETLTSEFLILSDGRILAHNLTPVLASVLAELNPADETINRRTMRGTLSKSGSSRANEAPKEIELETPRVVSYNSEHHS